VAGAGVFSAEETKGRRLCSGIENKTFRILTTAEVTSEFHWINNGRQHLIKLFKHCDKDGSTGYFAFQWCLDCVCQKNVGYLLLYTEESSSGLLSIHKIAKYATYMHIHMHLHAAYAVSITLTKVAKFIVWLQFS